MPRRALSPCPERGCPALTEGGRCAAHKRTVQAKHYESERGNSAQRGYDSKWRRYSAARLKTHPLCECPDCQAGVLRVMAASVTDHIVPPRLKEAFDSGDQQAIERAKALFWDRTNHQSMSKDCHDRKTATEDGGFGNTRAPAPAPT